MTYRQFRAPGQPTFAQVVQEMFVDNPDRSTWKRRSRGVLVAPESSEDLARALAGLIRDPARRRALGAAGQRRVRGEFALEANIGGLARRFGLA